MSYIKAGDVLPKELVDKIQDYIDGEYIYVPRKETNRKGWGAEHQSKTGNAFEKPGNLPAVYGGGVRRPSFGDLFPVSQKYT